MQLSKVFFLNIYLLHIISRTGRGIYQLLMITMVGLKPVNLHTSTYKSPAIPLCYWRGGLIHAVHHRKKTWHFKTHFPFSSWNHVSLISFSLQKPKFDQSHEIHPHNSLWNCSSHHVCCHWSVHCDIWRWKSRVLPLKGTYGISVLNLNDSLLQSQMTITQRRGC